jgi:hypothetical protein
LTVTTVIGDGGIWLRSDEYSPHRDYLLLVLGGDGYGQGMRGGTAGNLVLFRQRTADGAQPGRQGIRSGRNHTITVTASGDTFTVYINGAMTPVATYVDSTFPYG